MRAWEADKAVGLLVTAAVLCTFTTLTTVTRCYIRKFILKAFAVDDWLMAAASLAFIWYTTLILLQCRHNLYLQSSQLTLEEQRKGYFYWWLAYTCYPTSITLARASIGYFFLRLTVIRTQRFGLYINIYGNVTAGLMLLFIGLFQCVPISFFWERMIPGKSGHCIKANDMTIMGYVYGGACVVSDLAFIVRPVLLLRDSMMKKSKKYALIPVLSLGGIAAVCPLIRMAYLKSFQSADFWYDNYPFTLLCLIETGLAITANNLATFRPLWRLARSYLSSRPSSTAPSSKEGRPRASPAQGASFVRKINGMRVGVKLSGIALSGGEDRAWGYLGGAEDGDGDVEGGREGGRDRDRDRRTRLKRGEGEGEDRTGGERESREHGSDGHAGGDRVGGGRQTKEKKKKKKKKNWWDADESALATTRRGEELDTGMEREESDLSVETQAMDRQREDGQDHMPSLPPLADFGGWGGDGERSVETQKDINHQDGITITEMEQCVLR